MLISRRRGPYHPTRLALIAARYLGISLLTSRTTRFHGLCKLVSNYFGRRTTGTCLGLDRGCVLVGGCSGDRVIEDWESSG